MDARTERMYLADQLEAELKKAGLWSEAPSAMVEPDGPFGGTSLTFEEWLQTSLLPRLRSDPLVVPLPKSSNLVIAAIRNLDGIDNAAGIFDILSRIDKLVGTA